MDYQAIIWRFVASAREFCAWVEGTPGANEVYDVIRLVSRLHADAVMLPGVGDEHLPKGDDITEVSRAQEQAAAERFRTFPFQYYWEIFPYAHALQSIHEVMEATKDHTSFKLYFGVFADESTETVARLSVEHYLAEGSIPNSPTLIRKYYGEDLPPVSLFIGFDKFTVFDMPLLGTGEEDYYFSVSPSPYMTVHQLRSILYDHLYVRRTPEPDYTTLSIDELNQLREYYHANKDRAFGVGKLKFNVWFPDLGGGS